MRIGIRVRAVAACVVAIGCSRKSSNEAAAGNEPAPAGLEAKIVGTPSPESAIERIAISGDGRIAVAVDRKGKISRFELAGGTPAAVATLDGVRDLALSADGATLAIVAGDHLTVDGKPVALPAHRDATRAAFRTDGTLVVLANATDEGEYSESLHVLSLDGKRAVVTDRPAIHTESAGNCDLTLGQRGDVAVIENCSHVRAIRIRDGVELAEWAPSRTSVSAGVAEIAPGHFAVATVIGEDDYQLEVWLPGRGRVAGLKDLTPCTIAPTGRILACEQERGQVVVLDAATQTIRARADLPVAVRALRFTPDGSRLVAGLDDGRLGVIDTSRVHASVPALATPPAVLAIDAAAATAKDVPARTVKPSRTVAVEPGPIALIASPDGKQLAVQTAGRDTVVVDGAGTHEGRSIASWSAELKSPAAAWSPDGLEIALAESDPTERLRIVSTMTDKDPREVVTPLKETHVAWSTQGRIATGGATYHQIQIWDARTLAKLRVLHPPDDQWLGGLAFAPDGRLLSWGDWAPTIVWNPDTGAIVGRLVGHAGSVMAAAWSRDGRWIATIGRDQAVIVWNAATLVPVAVLRGMDAAAVVFAPDGDRLAVADREEIVVWSVPDGKPLHRFASDRPRSDLVAWPNQLVVGTATGLAWLSVPKP